MKIETQCKLLELKIKLTKPFDEIKRIVSQFFETEYFYRWKKTIYPWWTEEGEYAPTKIRNVWYLNNTWDGCGPVFGLLGTKIFHIYRNFRKYSINPDWCLDMSDIFEFGTQKEKEWGINRLLEEELTNKQSDIGLKYGKGYYEDESYVTLGYENNPNDPDNPIEYRIEKVRYGQLNKGKLTNSNSYYQVKREYHDSTGALVVDPFLNLGKQVDIAKIQNYFDTNKIDINAISSIKNSNYFYTSIILDVSELSQLSDTLKSHLRGRVPGLHQLYKLRKNIIKLSDMDITFSEPYKSEAKKISFLDTQAERDNAWKELNAKFKEDQKKLSAEIMEELLDCSDWID